MRRCVAVLSVLFVLPILFAVYDALAIAQEQASMRSVGPLYVEQFGIYNAITEISHKTGIPIGLDAVLPEKEQAISLRFSSGTMRQFLDQLVASTHDYEWEEGDDGMIYFTRNSAHASLLNQSINFPGIDKKTPWEVWNDMPNWIELNNLLRTTNCSVRRYVPNKEFRDRSAEIYISPGATTVRKLLDQIALQSGTKRWAVLQSSTQQAGSCEIEIRFW